MARGELAHLSCPDEIHTLALQSSENLLRQLDRHRSYRYRRRPHRSFGPDTLGYSECAGEKLVELRPHRADSARRGIRFLHLAKYLRLAHDHRIQAGRHPKNVPHGLFLAELV